jgi:hypothetical protein
MNKTKKIDHLQVVFLFLNHASKNEYGSKSSFDQFPFSPFIHPERIESFEEKRREEKRCFAGLSSLCYVQT